MTYNKIRQAIVIFIATLLYATPVYAQSPISKESPRDKLIQTTSGTDRRQSEDSRTFWQKTTDDPIAFFTLGLVGFTAILATVSIWQGIHLRNTVIAARNASEAQGRDMQASIKESARAAQAMQEVAQSIAISAKAATESVATSKEIASRQKLAREMQMRAYLTVVVGAEAFIQDRKTGLKFEAKPLVINTGHTPAREVTYRIKADILPMTLPPDFSFPLPQEVRGGSVIGPHQNVTLSGGVLDGYVSDHDVNDIIFAIGQRVLYVWGIVNYVDVFEEKRETKFGQIIQWRSDNQGALKVYGYYTKKNNEGT